MLVVKFDPRRVNLLDVGGRRLFLLEPDARSTFLVSDACPHRGGPLHLGRLDAHAGVLHCPWHGRRVPLCQLQRTALPLVRRRDCAIAIVPEAEDAPVRLRRRTLPGGAHNLSLNENGEQR